MGTTQAITGSLILSGSNTALIVSSSLIIYSAGAVSTPKITTPTGTPVGTIQITGSLLMTGSNVLTGNETITGSLNASGSINFRGVTNITGSLLFETGSVGITGSVLISGSVKGVVNALSITSNTASLNLTNGNFFTLTLPTAVNTFVSASNITPGQTINLVVSNNGTGTATFSNNIKQPSGSFYTATTGAGAVDVVTLISVDGSNLYMANTKNMI